MNLRIETATPADAEIFAQLNRQVHELHVDHVPRFFRPLTHQEATAAFRETLATDNGRGYVAYDGDTPIGYLLLCVRDRPANPYCRARRWLYLEQIAVEPNWQRQGVGRALVDMALQYARDAGIEEIEVETWAFNTTTQSFFRTMGFQLKMERLWLTRER